MLSERFVTKRAHAMQPAAVSPENPVIENVGTRARMPTAFIDFP